jgi:hypothetical protein
MEDRLIRRRKPEREKNKKIKKLQQHQQLHDYQNQFS